MWLGAGANEQAEEAGLGKEPEDGLRIQSWGHLRALPQGWAGLPLLGRPSASFMHSHYARR